VCFGHVDVEHGVTSLYPLQPGRVVEVVARETQRVEAGAVLLRLDETLARQRLREAEADRDAAGAQLAQARKAPEQQETRLAQQREAVEAMSHKAAQARHIHARKKRLYELNQLNADELKAAEEVVKEAEAGERAEKAKLRELELLDPATTVKRAEADVSAKLARVEQARKGVEECLVRAPVDGSVLRVLVGVGEVLGPNPTRSALIFCPDGPRLIRAEVEQEFASRVKAGYPATIQDDTTAKETTWRGKVVRVSDWYTHRRSILQEPLQFNDVRTLECIVEVDPDQPPLRIGQRVRVTIGQLAR
jgi:multidrug resistance efflux pump